MSSILALGTTMQLSGAPLNVGDVSPDFSLIVRKPFTLPDGRSLTAGSEVRLSDFAGSIVFFEWFAVWCPFCVAAAPQITEGIAEHYETQNGNTAGIPVIHVAVNQESRGFYQTQTDTFVQQQGFRVVLNDYTASTVNEVRNMFQAFGQPVFVAINGVTNSPTHKPWEILVNHLGYGDRQFAEEILRFRSSLNAVQPPPAAPVLSLPAQPITNDGFQFTIQASPGKSYRVEASNDLKSGTWEVVYQFEGNMDPVVYRDSSGPQLQRFYRVSSVP